MSSSRRAEVPRPYRDEPLSALEVARRPGRAEHPGRRRSRGASSVALQRTPTYCAVRCHRGVPVCFEHVGVPVDVGHAGRASGRSATGTRGLNWCAPVLSQVSKSERLLQGR